MPPSPADLEQRAERSVRRGELLVALELFEAYLAQVPDDARVRQRMESVRGLLQPSELMQRRRAEAREERPTEPAGDAEEGELHASSGRFEEALESYGRALAANPGNELLRERVEELARLVGPRRALEDGLASAPLLPAARAAQGPRTPGRAARAADSVFRPLEDEAPAHAAEAPPAPSSAVAPLPRDPVELLKALLGRVREGRRSKAADA